MRSKKKPEALIAESDAARQLYLVAREVERMYRLISRDFREKELSPDDVKERDLVWKRISEAVDHLEQEIELEMVRLKNM